MKSNIERVYIPHILHCLLSCIEGQTLPVASSEIPEANSIVKHGTKKWNKSMDNVQILPELQGFLDEIGSETVQSPWKETIFSSPP